MLKQYKREELKRSFQNLTQRLQQEESKLPQRAIPKGYVDRVKPDLEREIDRVKFNHIFGRDVYVYLPLTLISMGLNSIMYFILYSIIIEEDVNYFFSFFIIAMIHTIGLCGFFLFNELIQLLYIIFAILSQYLIIASLIGPNMQTQIFIFVFCLKSLYSYTRYQDIKPPHPNQNQNILSSYAYVLLKHFSIPWQIKRIITQLIIYAIPITIFKLFQYQFELHNSIDFQFLIRLLFIDIFSLYQSHKFLKTYKKHGRLNQINKNMFRIPLYAVPLILRDNYDQEVASLKYLLNLRGTEQLQLNQFLNPVFNQPEKITFVELIGDYFLIRLEEHSRQIISYCQQYEDANRNYYIKDDSIFRDIFSTFSWYVNAFKRIQSKAQLGDELRKFYFLYQTCTIFKQQNKQLYIDFGVQLVQMGQRVLSLKLSNSSTAMKYIDLLFPNEAKLESLERLRQSRQ
ncbi:hypothetical protein pb186bvf_016852 [Paramecium bursaria]